MPSASLSCRAALALPHSPDGFHGPWAGLCHAVADIRQPQKASILPQTFETPMPPLSNLQVLRGMAALLVVIFHVREEVALRYAETSWPDATFGAFGVDLFFVVSGFVMVYATSPSFGASKAAPAFFLRRLARIVPLYWAVTTAYMLFVIKTGQDPGYTAPFTLSSYLFFPYPQPWDGDYFPAYSLGWTLDYEIFFYACLSGVLALRRTAAVLALSAGLAALVLAGRLFPLPGPLSVWCNSQVLEFVFGMILAEAFIRGARLPGWLCATLVCMAFTAVLATVPTMGDWWAYRGLVWGLPGAALLAGAVFHVPGGRSLLRRFLERLGDASYSLYLLHYLVFVVVARALLHVPGSEHIPALVYAPMLLAASVGAAFLTYRLFERPVTRTLQRRLSSAPGSAVTPVRRRAGVTTSG